MLLLLLEQKKPIDEVVYFDFGVEFPEIEENVNKIENLCKNKELRFTRINEDFNFWLIDYKRIKGKRKGEAGYDWSDFRNRWCSRVKVRAITNYLRSRYGGGNYLEYVGIASDENRPSMEGKLYPLIENNVTEAQALKKCYEHGYDFGGLYNKIARASCFCCPLSRISELRYLYNERPELWERIKDMDSKQRRKFKPNYSIEELEEKFNKENKKET